MPASVTEDNPQTTGPESQENKLKTLNKVVSNPFVSSILENAKGYYNYAKDKSTLVKYASNKVETNLEYGVKWVAPKIEPVLQTELYKKYEPLLRKADDFGVQQVEKIEKMTEKITETYSQSKQMIEQKVTNITNDLKATTNALVEVSRHTFEEKIVPPVDNYLKASVLSVPLNATLTITEQICDQILPKEQVEAKEGKQEEKEEKPQTEVAGPVIRAGKLSRRIQREAFKKLSDLSLRPPEVRDAMKFSVDLIHYAATQIDTTTKIANQYVADSYAKTTNTLSNGVKVSKDRFKATLTVQQKNFHDAREKVHVMTDDALKALHTAIENLSKQIPEPVSQKAVETYTTVQNRSAALFAKLESNKELKAFTEVAKSSVAKLNETTHQLTQYATTASDALLHAQLVQSVTKTLTSVMDNLLNFGQKPKEQPTTEAKTETTETATPEETTPESSETEETTVTATPEETKEEDKVQETEEAPQETNEEDEDSEFSDDQ